MGVYKLMGVTKLMGVEEADLRCDVARRQVFYWRITVFIWSDTDLDLPVHVTMLGQNLQLNVSLSD